MSQKQPATSFQLLDVALLSYLVFYKIQERFMAQIKVSTPIYTILILQCGRVRMCVMLLCFVRHHVL